MRSNLLCQSLYYTDSALCPSGSWPWTGPLLASERRSWQHRLINWLLLLLCQDHLPGAQHWPLLLHPLTLP